MALLSLNISFYIKSQVFFEIKHLFLKPGTEHFGPNKNDPCSSERKFYLSRCYNFQLMVSWLGYHQFQFKKILSFGHYQI